MARLRLKVKGDEFKRALVRFLDTSKKDTSAILLNEAKLLVKEIVDLTPPASPRGKIKGRKALTAGKRRVKRDILKVMQGATRRRVERTDIEQVHQEARTAGRVGTRSVAKVLVPVRPLAEYIKDAQGLVGWLAAGWRVAAQKLKLTLPDWIARHRAPSAGKVIVSPNGVRVVLYNEVRFAGNISGLRRRVDRAVLNRSRALTRRVKDWARKVNSK